MNLSQINYQNQSQVVEAIQSKAFTNLVEEKLKNLIGDRIGIAGEVPIQGRVSLIWTGDLFNSSKADDYAEHAAECVKQKIDEFPKATGASRLQIKWNPTDSKLLPLEYREYLGWDFEITKGE